MNTEANIQSYTCRPCPCCALKWACPHWNAVRVVSQSLHAAKSEDSDRLFMVNLTGFPIHWACNNIQLIIVSFMSLKHPSFFFYVNGWESKSLPHIVFFVIFIRDYFLHRHNLHCTSPLQSAIPVWTVWVTRGATAGAWWMGDFHSLYPLFHPPRLVQKRLVFKYPFI